MELTGYCQNQTFSQFTSFLFFLGPLRKASKLPKLEYFMHKYLFLWTTLEKIFD